jgi:alkylated DNA repair dioxygenase AlkB
MKQLLKNSLNTDLSVILNTLETSNNTIHKNLKSRSTMNFGKVYQYKGVDYQETDYNDTPELIKQIGKEAAQALKEELGIDMNINNCLVNIYSNGKQSMGYHSDDTRQLVDGTGVLIVSVGCARILSFKKKEIKWVLSNHKPIIQKEDELEIIETFVKNDIIDIKAKDKKTRNINGYRKLSNGEYQLITSLTNYDNAYDYGGFLFEEIKPKDIIEDEFVLTNGSIFYMDDECQKEYEHAILKSADDSIRISLTFRELK